MDAYVCICLQWMHMFAMGAYVSFENMFAYPLAQYQNKLLLEMGIILLRYYGKQKYAGKGTYFQWQFVRRPFPYAQHAQGKGAEHFQDRHIVWIWNFHQRNALMWHTLLRDSSTFYRLKTNFWSRSKWILTCLGPPKLLHCYLTWMFWSVKNWLGLTHFWLTFPFYTPENIRKTKIFWRFQGT